MATDRLILILGTRTFALDVADVVEDIAGCRVAGFVENLDRAVCEKPLEGRPVYWIDDIAAMAGTHLGVCALSTTQRSKFTQQAEMLGLRFAILVHPSAQVSRRAVLGDGTFVNRGAIIAGYTTLGRHVIVNRGALIGHHGIIGDHCTIQPGAVIGGASRLGEGVYVGMGAKVLDKLSIGDGSVIGAGAVVTKDLPPHVQAMGVPAKVVKEGIERK